MEFGKTEVLLNRITEISAPYEVFNKGTLPESSLTGHKPFKSYNFYNLVMMIKI